MRNTIYTSLSIGNMRKSDVTVKATDNPKLSMVKKKHTWKPKKNSIFVHTQSVIGV